MNIGDRIKSRRKELQISVDEVADRIGKNRATVYRYESNDIENFPLSILKPISRALRCSPQYLMGWTNDAYDYELDVEGRMPSIPSEIFKHLMNKYNGDKSKVWAEYWDDASAEFFKNLSHEPPKGIRIPVLGTVPAGIPISAVEDIIDYEEIDERTAACGEYFALRVKGNSMQPTITDGETVIVKVQNSVDSGDVAVVGINGDEATIKRVKLTDKGIMLLPDNKDYEPYFYTNEEIENIPIRIIGKAIESRKKL